MHSEFVQAVDVAHVYRVQRPFPEEVVAMCCVGDEVEDVVAGLKAGLGRSNIASCFLP